MRVVALVDDLMDRSRLSGAVPDATFSRDAAACVDADVVVLDLARYATSVREVRTVAPASWIVAFGPHVDADLLGRARADGADAVVARSAFFHDPAGAVTRR